MLNFTDAVLATASSTPFGRGTGLIWMDNMQCVGNETRLELCSFPGWGISYSYCRQHNRDVGVVCNSESVCVNVCVWCVRVCAAHTVMICGYHDCMCECV